jgi:hypothetical protein
MACLLNRFDWVGGMGVEGHLLQSVDRYSRSRNRWYSTEYQLPMPMASFAIGIIGELLIVAGSSLSLLLSIDSNYNYMDCIGIGGWISAKPGYSNKAWCIKFSDFLKGSIQWSSIADLPAPIKHMAYLTIQ